MGQPSKRSSKIWVLPNTPLTFARLPITHKVSIYLPRYRSRLAVGRVRHSLASRPPSPASVVPMMNLVSPLANNATAAAISTSLVYRLHPRRYIGMIPQHRVSIAPDRTASARVFTSAPAIDMVWVSDSIPALVAEWGAALAAALDRMDTGNVDD